MTTNADVRPASPITCWLAMALFALAVLTAALGVIFGSTWAALLGSFAILLPDTVRIASGWKAQRDFFNGPQYETLRSPALRRPALLLTAALMLIMLAAAAMGSWKIAVASVYLTLLPLSILLQKTRGMSVLADPVLDERQRQRRDAAYRTAYLIVVAALGGGTVILGVTQMLFHGRQPMPLDARPLVLMVLVGIAQMVYLPSLICAWNEPNADN